MKRPSTRFTPSRWSELLTPASLIILFLILLGTILFVILYSLGILSFA